MNVSDKINLIIQANKYSDGEIHDISKWCCGMRDFEDEPEKVKRIEKMLQAFINRKKLNIPVTTKSIQKEFLGI